LLAISGAQPAPGGVVVARRTNPVRLRSSALPAIRLDTGSLSSNL